MVCVVSVFAGSDSGRPGFVEGAGTTARFYAPGALAYHFDPTTNAGRLLVVDRGNERIRAIDLKTGECADGLGVPAFLSYDV